jgi:hypothetical protein
LRSIYLAFSGSFFSRVKWGSAIAAINYLEKYHHCHSLPFLIIHPCQDLTVLQPHFYLLPSDSKYRSLASSSYSNMCNFPKASIFLIIPRNHSLIPFLPSETDLSSHLYLLTPLPSLPLTPQPTAIAFCPHCPGKMELSKVFLITSSSYSVLLDHLVLLIQPVILQPYSS